MAKKVSIKPIGDLIRKKQREIKATMPGMTAAEKKKARTKIKGLDRCYKHVNALCSGGWK